MLAPKYRGKVFYQEKKAAIGKILRQLCEWKGVRIIEAEACPEHIHMLVEKPPKMAVSSFMGYLKGKSNTMLYEQFGELKYKYRSREFWCRGYYEETAGKNAGRIQEYIKNQLKEDERTVNDPAKRPVYGQQVTIFTQLADRTCTFTRPRGTKGYARISKTPGFAGGCLLWDNTPANEPFRRKDNANNPLPPCSIRRWVWLFAFYRSLSCF